ncbi:hypothetical protein [Streptomyces sp. 7N604]
MLRTIAESEQLGLACGDHHGGTPIDQLRVPVAGPVLKDALGQLTHLLA